MRHSIVVVLLLCLSLIGCQDIKKSARHIKSSMVGLNREITLYAVDGSIIQQWKTKAMVEVVEGTVSFINNNNKEVKLLGTITIIEE